MAEFVNIIETDEWEIETPNGWESIKGVGKTIEYDEWSIKTKNFSMIGADDHIIFDHFNNEIKLKNAKKGDYIITKYGFEEILEVCPLNKSHMYDLLMDDTTSNTYYTNGIKSHNSIWLGNIAYNIMMTGKNVLLISLEMRAHKIYKRIGANAFDIKVSDYMKTSNQIDKMTEILNDFDKKHKKELIPLGMLRTKKFSSATPNDIKAYIKRVEEHTGKKIHVCVIDYLTEMQSDYGITLDQMYNLHKQNVSDLASIAEDDDLAMITAHQLKIKGYGLADIDLTMLGESSGIIHRTDNIWGIIQTPEMKLAREYYLKNMKSRDNGFKDYRQLFKIDYDHMRLTEYGDMQSPGDFIIARDEATHNHRSN